MKPLPSLAFQDHGLDSCGIRPCFLEQAPPRRQTQGVCQEQHAVALWVLSWPLIPPPPCWMNTCCRDMEMFQVVVPAGKRDCERSRAVQTCVQRRSGPSRGPARPSPWEGRSVDVPPGSQPAGQSWGVRRILRRCPLLNASQPGTCCRCGQEAPRAVSLPATWLSSSSRGFTGSCVQQPRLGPGEAVSGPQKHSSVQLWPCWGLANSWQPSQQRWQESWARDPQSTLTILQLVPDKTFCSPFTMKESGDFLD